MAKITLDSITAAYASNSLLNTNFTAIQDELNNNVLYRNNPAGEANQMANDLDMNSNHILNADTVYADGMILGGVTVTPTGITTLPAASMTYDNSTSGLAATTVQAAVDEVEARVDTAETNITSNDADIAALEVIRDNGNNHGKNLIINGDFSIWQRATSSTTSGYNTDDRWTNVHSGSTKIHNRQNFTLGQTDVPGNPKYYSSTIVTSVAGAANLALKAQLIENVATLSGREVTLSFYAKADSAKDIATEYVQNFGSGGSPSASVTGIGVTTHSLTTSWQRFTVTTTIPSVSGKSLGSNGNDYVALNIWFDAGSNYNARTNTLGQQSGTFDIANVQIEFGDAATDFEYVSPADQLARCKRYAEVLDVTSGGVITQGQCTSTTQAEGTVQYTTKRAAPTISSLSGTWNALTAAGAPAGGSETFLAISKDLALMRITGAVGLVAGNCSSIFSNGSAGSILIDAEL